MIDAHERNPEAAGRAGQCRLEVGDGDVRTEGLELGDHAIDQRPDLAGLVVEAGRDRSHHVEPATDVLEDDPRDRLDAHPGHPQRQSAADEVEAVGARVDEHIVCRVETLDERAHAGCVAPPLPAEADRDVRHRQRWFRRWRTGGAAGRRRTTFCSAGARPASGRGGGAQGRARRVWHLDRVPQGRQTRGCPGAAGPLSERQPPCREEVISRCDQRGRLATLPPRRSPTKASPRSHDAPSRGRRSSCRFDRVSSGA